MAEVLELRQYTLHPGRRDELIELFDQDAVGLFRDRDDEDRYVSLGGSAEPPMIDSVDVLRLRPVKALDLTGRSGPTTLVTITLYHLPPGGEDAFVDFFAAEVEPMLAATGAPPLAVLRTPHADVREGANVVAWIASFPGPDELREHVRQLGREPRWTHDTLPMLTKQLSRPPEQLQLSPTNRSLLR